MVINGGAIQFTDSDRENFTVKKYTDEEIKCNSEQFLKKRKKRRCVFLIILISIPPLCGGTNSDERFLFPLHCAIIVSRSYTTKHGRRSCRNLSRFKTAY